MSRYLKSFFITITIYIIIILFLIFLFRDVKLTPEENKNNITKISLNNITITQDVTKPNAESEPDQIQKEQLIKPSPQPKTEPIGKPTVKPAEKPVEQPKPVEKPIEKKVEKETPKVAETKKVEAKKIEEIKKNISKNLGAIKPPQNIQQNISKPASPLENFLGQKDSTTEITNNSTNYSSTVDELKELYGAEYNNFTKAQKSYLEKNLNAFQVITQRVLNRLGYPRLAAKLRIGGANIIEFYFHPNGDISGLRILNSSSYSILDDYSLNLIKVAYKDYPKPDSSIKIRFRVVYSAY